MAKPPPKPPPPPGRKTMEIDISWLEEKPEEKKDAKAARKKPPRMPGAAVTVPPMPVQASQPPAGRKTIEVELDWVELVDENGNVVKKPVEKKEKK